MNEEIKDLEIDILDDEKALENDMQSLITQAAYVQKSLITLKLDYKKLAELYKNK